MFTLRNALLLLAALLVASGTAVYVKTWLEAEKSAIAASQQDAVEIVEAGSVQVLVAKVEMPAGTFLKVDNLNWQAWPEDGVHDDYMVKADDADDADPVQSLEGAVVRTRLRAGEPVTQARVVHPGDRGFLAAVLEPGFRAVSVPIDATTGISGFVFPGDWVDIVMTMRLRGESEGARQQRFFAQTVLERIRVLAIDQAVEKEDGEIALAKTATLEVTPKEAERVAVALDMGKLSLSLHSLSPSEMAEALQERLIGGDAMFDPDRVRNQTRSYTLDEDVYHMWDDGRMFPRKGSKNQIHVVRGSESQVQSY